MPKGRLFWAKSARRRPSPTKTDFKQVHWCVLFIYASVRRHKYVKFKTETTNINWLEHFLFSCEFPLLYQNWWQMFLLVSVRHVGTHPGGNQHGVSIQIAINLGKTFLRISRIRNILLAWILARVFVYLPPFISQIPGFIIWTVLILILIYFEWRDIQNQQ